MWLIIRAGFCCSTIHNNLQTHHTDYCVYLVSCQCVSEQRGHTKLSLRLSGIITNLDKDIISARNQLGSKGGPAEHRFRQDSDSTNPAGSLEEDAGAKPVTLKKPSRRHNTDHMGSHHLPHRHSLQTRDKTAPLPQSELRPTTLHTESSDFSDNYTMQTNSRRSSECRTISTNESSESSLDCLYSCITYKTPRKVSRNGRPSCRSMSSVELLWTEVSQRAGRFPKNGSQPTI